MLGFEKILRAALAKKLCSVHEKNVTLSLLPAADDENDPRGGGVVEEVVGQEKYRLYKIGLDDGFADVALPVATLVAASSADGSGIEDNCQLANVGKRSSHVLHP